MLYNGNLFFIKLDNAKKENNLSENIMQKKNNSGRVVAVYGTVYIIYYNSSFYTCSLAGKFRTQKTRDRNPLTIGDFVDISLSKDYIENQESSILKPLSLNDDTIIITNKYKQANEIIRSDGNRSHKLGVNLDQVFLIQSFAKPKLNWNFIFRVQAAANAGKVKLHIFINKADILQEKLTLLEQKKTKIEKKKLKLLKNIFKKLFDNDNFTDKEIKSYLKKLYPFSSFENSSNINNNTSTSQNIFVSSREEDIADTLYKFLYLIEQGLSLYFISAEKQKIEVFKKIASNKFSLIIGPSGVGKSTLINKTIGEDLYLKTNEISNLTNKGRHTTTTSLTISIPDGGFLVDTPGIKTWGLSHLNKEQILYSFKEVDDFSKLCAFKNCRHDENSKDCAIRSKEKEDALFQWRHRVALSLVNSIDYPDKIRKGDHLRGVGPRKRKK